MKNETRIKPLLEYTVVRNVYTPEGLREVEDTFTGDHFVRDEQSVVFYRTGNVVRVYLNSPDRIIVTPVDELPE